MYRFIGVIKGRKSESPYDLMITHKDFIDKEKAFNRLEIYTKLDIPKAIFTIIENPVFNFILINSLPLSTSIHLEIP